MAEPKCLTPVIGIPLFLPKKPVCQTMSTSCKIKEASVKKERIVEVNIKHDVLSQMNEQRMKHKNLFPSRPLMGYNWYKWEDRGQNPYGAVDRLYRSLKITPPSMYSSYSLDSPAGLDPIQTRRSRHFPRLKRNIRCLVMKDTIPSYCSLEMVKNPLPLLSSFPCSPRLTDPKIDKGPSEVGKQRMSRRLPFSDAQSSSEELTKKRERSVSSKEMEAPESAPNSNEFLVKGQSLQQDIMPYMPHSFVSHNEYMSHFQNYSDESDDD